MATGNRTHDLSGMAALFVVFNFITGRIVNVYDNSSEVPQCARVPGRGPQG
jgi:hypothetical protein